VVTTVDQRNILLTVERESGELITCDPSRLRGVSVYREALHYFAIGDHIRFTAPDRQPGVANETPGCPTILCVHE
jgi:hypothetical protein